MDDCPAQPNSPLRSLREPEFWLLLLLVALTYFPRLTTLNVRGEEPRRGRVAYEMMASGDYIVPRQQGLVYLSRPPLHNWLIVLCAKLHGRIDELSIRLPSVLATIATALMLYVYARGWLSRLGAFVAGLAYSTMGLSLELGRLGETDAVLTLLVSGSLLVWHAGYQRRASLTLTWCLGYTLAALAALAKGPQGPVYFSGSVCVFLALRRDWRMLFSRAHMTGLAAMAVVIGAWLLPFALATDWPSVQTIWWANAAERFADSRPSSIVRHLVQYPIELCAGLLPWSLPLAYLCHPRFRARLADIWPWVSFCLVAIGVCLPSVWLAAAAHGRYFLPLFPICGVLAGVVVDRCWHCSDMEGRRALNRYLLTLSLITGGFGLFSGLASAVPGEHWMPSLGRGALSQPLPEGEGAEQVVLRELTKLWPVYAAVGLIACAGLWLARRARSPRAVVASFAGLAGCLAVAWCGVITDLRQAASVDIAAHIAELKTRLPADAALVSLGEVSHMFAYHFHDPIAIAGRESIAAGAYFCFSQLAGRVVDVPFAWEPVEVIPLDRVRLRVPERMVVVARRVSQVPPQQYSRLTTPPYAAALFDARAASIQPYFDSLQPETLPP